MNEHKLYANTTGKPVVIVLLHTHTLACTHVTHQDRLLFMYVPVTPRRVNARSRILPPHTRHSVCVHARRRTTIANPPSPHAHICFINSSVNNCPRMAATLRAIIRTAQSDHHVILSRSSRCSCHRRCDCSQIFAQYVRHFTPANVGCI